LYDPVDDRPPLSSAVDRRKIPGGLKVCDANGQSLAYFYARENDHDAHLADGGQPRQAAGAARRKLERIGFGRCPNFFVSARPALETSCYKPVTMKLLENGMRCT